MRQRGNVVVDRIDSVTELSAGVGAVAALEAVIGEDVADRVLQGCATLCDVVMTSWAMNVDAAQAVVQYAEAVLRPTLEASGSRCA